MKRSGHPCLKPGHLPFKIFHDRTLKQDFQALWYLNFQPFVNPFSENLVDGVAVGIGRKAQIRVVVFLFCRVPAQTNHSSLTVPSSFRLRSDCLFVVNLCQLVGAAVTEFTKIKFRVRKSRFRRWESNLCAQVPSSSPGISKSTRTPFALHRIAYFFLPTSAKADKDSSAIPSKEKCHSILLPIAWRM